MLGHEIRNIRSRHRGHIDDFSLGRWSAQSLRTLQKPSSCTISTGAH